MTAPTGRRGLTYFVAASIDGFIADTDGSLDAFFPLPDGLLEHLVAEYPETIPTHLHDAVGITAATGRFDTVVQGRSTYESGVRQGVTSPYAHLTQYVVSRSLTSPDPAVEIIADDPARRIRELKEEQPGLGIWLAGGGTLAGALLPEIDELVVKVYPLVLGAGVPLFRGTTGPVPFDLATSRSVGAAAVQTWTRRH